MTRTWPLTVKRAVLDIHAGAAGLGEIQFVTGIGDQAHRQKQSPVAARYSLLRIGPQPPQRGEFMPAQERPAVAVHTGSPVTLRCAQTWPPPRREQRHRRSWMVAAGMVAAGPAGVCLVLTTTMEFQ